MKICNVDNFYKQDEEKYKVFKNKELLNFLKDSLKSGYAPSVDIKDLQGLINFIISWYEIKYPERDLIIENNTNSNINSPRYDLLNCEYLLYCLPEKYFDIMNVRYKSQLLHSYAEKDLMNLNLNEAYVSYIIKNKKDRIFIDVDSSTGKVLEASLKKLGIYKQVNLKELLMILSKNNMYEYDSIKEAVKLNEMEFNLMKKLLEMVSIGLLYSKNTVPELGYKRSQKFIKEFNEFIPSLNLELNNIDEIMNKDYSKDIISPKKEDKTKSKRKILKR